MMFAQGSLCLLLLLGNSSSLPTCIGPSRTSKIGKKTSELCTVVQCLAPLCYYILMFLGSIPLHMNESWRACWEHLLLMLCLVYYIRVHNLWLNGSSNIFFVQKAHHTLFEGQIMAKFCEFRKQARRSSCDPDKDNRVWLQPQETV
jgi:hypothetical protein